MPIFYEKVTHALLECVKTLFRKKTQTKKKLLMYI